MKMYLAAMVLCACSESSKVGPTSPGALTGFSSLAGDGSGAWNGFTGVLDGSGTVTLTSQFDDQTAAGALTASGRSQLADLVGALPIDTPTPAGGCGDGSTVTLDIDFVHGGAHTYTFESCDSGAFTDLSTFIDGVASALIAGTSSDDVTVTP